MTNTQIGTIQDALFDLVESLTDTESDALEMLDTLRQIDAQLRTMKSTYANAARRQDATWAQIGGALEISKQAAQQRFGTM